MNTSSSEPIDERKPSGENTDDIIGVEPQEISDEIPTGTISDILKALSILQKDQLSYKNVIDRQALQIQALQDPIEETTDDIYQASINSAFENSPHPERNSTSLRDNNTTRNLSNEFDRNINASDHIRPIVRAPRDSSFGAVFSAYENANNLNQDPPVDAIREVHDFVPPTPYPSSNPHNNYQQQRRAPINQQNNRPSRANNNYSHPTNNSLPSSTATAFHPTSNFFDQESRNFVPERNTNHAVTHTTVGPNAATSQCRLTVLDFAHLHRFQGMFLKEQNKFIGWNILMVDYISFAILMILQAHDFQHNITRGQMQIQNERCNLSNNSIYHLLFSYCCPKTKMEWLNEFIRTARDMFPKPPSTFKLNINEWQWCYESYLMYIHQITKLYNMMTQNDDPDRPETSLIPPMKTKDGIMGLMEITTDLVPAGIGKHMHNMLDATRLKECKSVHDYLYCLKSLNTHLYNKSKAAKADQISFDSVGKNSVSSILNNLSTKYPASDSFPKNPSQPTNPHRPQNDNKHLFNIDDDRRYNMNRNVNSDNPYRNNPYDLYDPTVDNTSKNSTSHITPKSNDELEYLNSLSNPPKDISTMPCFSQYNTGKCIPKPGEKCGFAHSNQAMSGEWHRRSKDLQQSPWKVVSIVPRPSPAGSATGNNRGSLRQLALTDAEPQSSQVSFAEQSDNNTPLTPSTINYNDIYEESTTPFDELNPTPSST